MADKIGVFVTYEKLAEEMHEKLVPGVEIFHSEDLSLPHEMATFFILAGFVRQENTLVFKSDTGISIDPDEEIQGYVKVTRVSS